MAGVIGCLFFLNGCGLIYTDVRLPYSYRSATPSDVQASWDDASQSGRACNMSLLYLVEWGDSGYAAAVRDALKHDPQAILYDVKVDVRLRSYLLGLYTQLCTIATGKLGHP
jgi:hypothetical protein